MSPVVLVLFVGFCIQFLKIIIDTIRCRSCIFKNFFSSWGFPSFHTGISSSVTTLLLLHYGPDSYFFAVAVAFSLLIAYDAMNLRYEAGQHAHYINNITNSLTNTLINKNEGQKKISLKERIWHTPLEVLGGIVFGAWLTFILYYQFML